MTTTRTASTAAEVLAVSPAEWASARTADRDRAASLLHESGFRLASIIPALGYGRGTGTVSRAIRRHVRRTTGTVAASSERRFGVEIECVATPNRGQTANCEAAAAALRAAGIDARYEGYTHAINGWKVVYDVSVTGGVEVVSPPLSGEAGLAEVATVVEALRGAGFRVDRSCGLHVHHEATDLLGSEIARLVDLYIGRQAAIDSLVAPSRRAGRGGARHVAPFTASEARALAARVQGIEGDTAAAKIASAQRLGLTRHGDRYRVLNVCSFGAYGTVEFRQHQGTLNASKIAAWVRLGQAIIEAARNADAISTESMLADLVAAGRLDAASAEYLTARQDVLA